MIQNPRVARIVYMCLAVLLFNISDGLTKYVTQSFATVPVLFIRVGLALPFLMFVVWMLRVPVDFRTLRYFPFIFRGVIFSFTLVFFAEALQQNTFTSFYIVFFASIPIVSILIDFVWFRKIPSIRYVTIVFGMMLFAVGPKLFAASDLDALYAEFGAGAVYTAITAFLYVFYIFFSNNLSKIYDVDPVTANLPNFICAIFIFGLIVGFSSGEISDFAIISSFDINQISAIVVAAIVSVAGAILIIKATTGGDASQVVPFEYTAIIYAVVIDWVMLSEKVDFYDMISAAGILVLGAYLAKLEASD